jgi:hypothetical protein
MGLSGGEKGRVGESVSVSSVSLGARKRQWSEEKMLLLMRIDELERENGRLVRQVQEGSVSGTGTGSALGASGGGSGGGGGGGGGSGGGSSGSNIGDSSSETNSTSVTVDFQKMDLRNTHFS